MNEKKTRPAPFFVMLDERAGQPFYRQIYDSIRGSILSGDFASGMRLPATRLLASQLGVSRMTVINAYEQLFAEGYLEGRAGSGTFVASRLPEEYFKTDVVLSKRKRAETVDQTGAPGLSAYGEYIKQNHQRILKHEGATTFLPFQHGLPAVDEFPFDVWTKLAQRHYKYFNRRMFGYGDPAGLPALREAIAVHLKRSRGVVCDAGQVIITNGAQQALHLIGSVLLSAGDDVWIEDPGYLGARDVLQAMGTNVIPVAIDDEGFDLQAAAKFKRKARVIYVTPSRQFPTGTTMSLPRRLGLLDWASENDALIIEDDYDSEFRYAGRPLAALQGLDRDGRVLYLGTFSKTIFPGLRLGCLVVPDALVDIFAAARSLIDLHSQLTDQAVLAEFITEGHFDRHLRKMRSLYKARQQVLVDEVQSSLSGAIEIEATDAGMHLVGWLQAGVDDRAIAETASANDLVATPLSRYYLRKPERGGLLLGYTGFNEKQIKTGVLKLASVFADAGL